MSSKFATVFAPPPKGGEKFPSDVVICKSRTRQEFLHESLTSTIMDRFAKTGVLVPPGMNRREPLFGDFSDLPSGVEEAFALVDSVNRQFASLPSKIRDRFQSPSALYAFLSDAKNYDEAVSLNLIEKRVKVDDSAKSPTGDLGGVAAVETPTIDTPTPTKS